MIILCSLFSYSELDPSRMASRSRHWRVDSERGIGRGNAGTNNLGSLFQASTHDDHHVSSFRASAYQDGGEG
jgi:hypothetical protein